MQLPGYQLEGKIGEGGMASVYRGRQLSLDRSVAIKVLDSALVADEAVRQAFEREARLVASLNHPHIIHIIDRGLTPEGVPYFVMEYVEGIDLAAVIRLNSLPFARRLSICIQVSQALAYAHNNGIIHRDIKPANILINKQGNAHVLDFGIATLAGEQAAAEMGTESYMAPELLEGRTAASESTDIYSLGLLMYELLAGFLPPRSGALPAIGNQQPGFPPTLDALLRECLASEPSQRPESVQQIHSRLLQISAGAHLSNTQRQRARDSFDKKNFVLLDVLQEKRDGAVYLFEESNSRNLLVLKKRSAGSGGYNEARRLTHLQHPNLARVLGVSGNERVFVIATEYLAGGSLAQRLISPWPIGQFFPTARAIASGVAHAAQNSLHHGELRPSNVLFDSDNVVKIADFALAADNPADQQAYRHPACQTPEQQDIYSTGVMFYQMLLGELPATDGKTLRPTRNFRLLPIELQTLLQRMLEPARPDACRHFSEIVQKLDEQQAEADTQVMQYASEQASRTAGVTGRGRRVAMLAAAALLAAGGALAWWWLHAHPLK